MRTVSANRRLIIESLVVLVLTGLLLYNLETGSLSFNSRIWPLVILIPMGLIAVSILMSVFVGNDPVPPAPVDDEIRDAPIRRYSMMVLYSVYILALPYLGFALVTILFVPVASKILGMQLRLSCIAQSVVVAVVIYFLFAVAFKVPLPEGTLRSLVVGW